MLYVLLSKMGDSKEMRPVAVVDNEATATKWGNANKDNDWIPLELNDMSMTGMGTAPASPVTQPSTEAVEKTRKNLQDANRLLETTIKNRVKSHAKQAAEARSFGDFVQGVVNGYLSHRAEEHPEDPDPEIYDFLDWMKTSYRANMTEKQYDQLTDAAYQLYKKTFGPK